MKKIYVTPQIEVIELDHEISLALESSPPEGPGEDAYLIPEYFNSEPYQTVLGQYKQKNVHLYINFI